MCAARESAPRGDNAGRVASTLNILAWNVVRFAPVTEDGAREAVAKARRAVELAPGSGSLLNTLGVALYRAGEFQEALDTLTRSAEMNAKTLGDQPGDWAFIAMTRWRLNQADDAHAALAKLRELAAEARWKADEETKRWLQEAESLMAEPPP